MRAVEQAEISESAQKAQAEDLGLQFFGQCLIGELERAEVDRRCVTVSVAGFQGVADLVPAHIRAVEFVLVAHVRTAQSFADALAVREQGLQQKLHYMQDFWACYKARCADGSKLYVQYLWILDQEDRQRFMPIVQIANALTPKNSFLSSRYTSGLDDVQWLITQLCEPARYGVMQEIRSPKNRSVTTEPLAWWQWLNNTESYAAWRDCRNKVAYAVKP